MIRSAASFPNRGKRQHHPPPLRTTLARIHTIEVSHIFGGRLPWVASKIGMAGHVIDVCPPGAIPIPADLGRERIRKIVAVQNLKSRSTSKSSGRVSTCCSVIVGN